MIIQRLIMPYIIASQHSILHYSFLFMGFFCKIDFLRSDALPNTKLQETLNYMMIAHTVCVLIETTISFFRYRGMNKEVRDVINPYRHAYLQKTLTLIKLFVFFIAIMYS